MNLMNEMYEWMYVRMCACMHACMHVCVLVRVSVCLHAVFVYMCAYCARSWKSTLTSSAPLCTWTTSTARSPSTRRSGAWRGCPRLGQNEITLAGLPKYGPTLDRPGGAAVSRAKIDSSRGLLSRGGNHVMIPVELEKTVEEHLQLCSLGWGHTLLHGGIFRIRCYIYSLG